MSIKNNLIGSFIAVFTVIGIFIFTGYATADAAPKKLPNGCLQANPTVTIVPPSITSVVAGGSLVYQTTVKNNDSAKCGSSVFTAIPYSSATSYSWFYGTVKSATISPGASYSFSAIITPPIGTPSGVQGFVYRATNSAYPAFWANSNQATLTIVAQ